MFVPRGSNALARIVIWLLLFWTAPSVIADEGFCDSTNINEPIGIDLGYQYIGASYANSTTIFTPLALLRDDEYVGVISQLATEHSERANLKKLFGDRDGSSYAKFNLLITQLASKLIAQIPYIDHPYVELITSTTSRVYTSVSAQIRQFIRTVLLLLRSRAGPEPLTLAKVEETFTRVFLDLQASALADTGTKLSFALIGIPDFFNETIAGIVVAASRKAGIETGAHALPRTMLTHFENPAVPEGSSVLVLHQGMHHCGIRAFAEGGSRAGSRKPARGHLTKRKKMKVQDESPTPRNFYLPLDPWRSQIIHQRLMGAVIRSNPELQTQLEIGADQNILLASVVQARLLLKQRDLGVVYLGLESRSADFHTTIGEDVEEGDYLDEVPLRLDDWWVYGSDPGVELTREAVVEADADYVRTLSRMITSFVNATRETPDFQQNFDHVAILTDWVDGDLVHRAVKTALGEEIPLVGGSLSDLYMVADGAARMSLIRRQNLLRMRGEEYDFAHDEL
ncbi:hypothetical protein BJY01DRAFT_220949 [Aspergillus pseudoustus]|uniref:Uncharacterized protein n=1 Tax=Aspergillus pseudoustus TaxID=1810923 RepID=A0ABR4JD16_9EURO